ncbi:TTN [Symbiodinium sp. CCMP2592]|nr:TTN [Symbiodinium sp. CCMP2592]
MELWLNQDNLENSLGTSCGWLILAIVLLFTGIARLSGIFWGRLTDIRLGLSELTDTCALLGSQLEAWNATHAETFKSLETSILALLQDHRRAVVCEPQGFLQPLLLENWNRTRLDILQQIRLLGLELQDMRETMGNLIKVQALIRKSLIPVTTDTPGDIREINGHLTMIREGIEMDTQGLLGAVQGMEERLQRVRQELRNQPTLHPQFQSEVLMQLSVIRAQLNMGTRADDSVLPGSPPPWA